MPAEDVDVVVIGLGPGGEFLTGELARAGLSVVGVDKRLVGGECPYYACIPTKAMIRASDSLAEARRANELAGSVQVTPDWTPVAKRLRDEVTADWDDQAAVDRLVKAGARVERGDGRITGPGEVTVGDLVLRARRGIVLNPGTDPAVPAELADTPVWTNRDAVRTTEVPESLIVLGGGPVGCEFAQIFARFGAQVTLIQRNERLLPQAEPEGSEVLKDVLTREGIQVLTGTNVVSATHDGTYFHVVTDKGTITVKQVLAAAGRGTDLPALGLATVGLPDDGRHVEVDDRMRATDGVWAIGDITGKGAFTHMSMYQAEIATADILGKEHTPAQYHAVPHVTFTDPEVAGVGLTEAAARARG
ncbi:NAD(P)/FAD-dependent oxidoreductase [Kibdelosporangium lantanae]